MEEIEGDQYEVVVVNFYADTTCTEGLVCVVPPPQSYTLVIQQRRLCNGLLVHPRHVRDQLSSLVPRTFELRRKKICRMLRCSLKNLEK